VVVDGEEHFFADVAGRDAFLREHKFLVEEPEAAAEPAPAPIPEPATNGNGNGRAIKKEQDEKERHWQRLQKNQELHEVKELEKVFRQMEDFGLSIDDYYLTQEESVSGDKLPTKYVLTNEEGEHDVAGVGQIVLEIHQLVKKGGGLEIKRFKGLGEMNAEQLWETTLNPADRNLLRVTLHEAAEAERMFSVLMGEDVERRRQFIEEHALEVKNLDV
jgi:DNA gyrase subunit B